MFPKNVEQWPLEYILPNPIMLIISNSSAHVDIEIVDTKPRPKPQKFLKV